MTRMLLATAAMGALFAGTMASAQGITLYGDARLGLGYNIDNDGGVLVDDDDNTPDDLRAVSRVRFGVNMTGETDSGITFGADIRADNAEGGQGGDDGQTEGEVFVSGSWGTLTFGDTNAADEQWVGDVPGNYSLTGLTDINETRFISNGGSFGNDTGNAFAENPFARPTIRYDFDWEGFGLSLSSNRDLTDIGVGGGYATDFGGGSWSIGVGYYDFASFVETGEAGSGVAQVCIGTIDATGACIGDLVDVLVPELPVEAVIPDGQQWSVGVNAEYETFAVGITYTDISSDTEAFGTVKANNLLVGASATFNAWSVGAFYGKVLSAEGSETFEVSDGDDAYGLTGQYDLGGGASINGGIANTYAVPGLGGDNDSATIADFGITLNF